MAHPRTLDNNPNPQNEASCVSKATFWWTKNIFRLGYQRELKDVDIYDVLPEDSSVKLSNDLGREWEKELYKWKTGGRPSLFSALLRCYGSKVGAIGLVFFLVEGFRIAQAIFLGYIVTYFEAGSQMTSHAAYVYAVAWSAAYVLVLAFDNLAFHKSFYYGLKMRVAATSLIYRKILRLSHSSLQDTSTATIVNLLAADARRFDQSCLGINYIWIGPVEAVVVMALLWRQLQLGPTCLLGLAVLVLLTPLQFLLGRFLTKLRYQMSQLSDRRVRMTGEIIAGIKTIKINCWEKAFSTLISTLRRSEWTYLRAMCHVRGVNSAMYYISGKVLMFATFTTYLLLGQESPASVIFTSLALYEVLRASVSLLLPWGVQYFLLARTAVARIQDFLLLEERTSLDSHYQTGSTLKRSPLPDNIALKLEDFSASWDKDANSLTLDGISLTVQKARLLALTGPIASGKSSLLLATVGEVPRIGGFARSSGRLAYVPQSSWILPSTIRDNILFGCEMDRTRYHQVLQACALGQDLVSFPSGDVSIIGERGVHLTNSQKAKISLARAVYHEADIYLVDDIFGAMDEPSAITIFTKCFCGLLNAKTIIYVTHSLRFIKPAETVVVMVQGKVSNVGTYRDLKNRGVDFEELLADYHELHDSEGSLVISGGVKGHQRFISESDEALNSQRTLGVDSSYGSQESLEQIWLEVEKSTAEPADPSDDDKQTTRGRTYFQYLYIGGGNCVAVFFIILSITAQAMYILCDWWLYHWSQAQSPASAKGNGSHSELDLDISVLTSSTFVRPVSDFYVYLGVFVAFVILGVLRATVFSVIAVGVSKSLHNKVFRSIMRAPMSYFAANTPGQILCRLSRDIGYVDDALPASYFDFVQFSLLVSGALVLAAVCNYWLLLALVPMVALFIYARHYYIATARDIKRLESQGKVPLYQHLSNTLDGLYVIRAFASEERFLRSFDMLQDRQTATSYLHLAINRWFAIRLDAVSAVFVAILAIVSIATKDTLDINPGLIGMSLAYALNLLGLFQYSMRQSSELENELSGLDRIVQLTEVQHEADLITSHRPAHTWPQYGIVTFEGVSQPGGGDAEIMRNIWCCFRAHEKVGILVDPEGSVKAFTTALLRLREASRGIIRIDGIDIAELGLHDLREHIFVVPDDPVLFAGTMRRNLDPFIRYPDAHLWTVLGEVKLKDKVEKLPGKMYADMSEFGNNFSLGERQLLCLARAMLRNSKVVIFEETDSVIEKRTESILKHVLSTRFQQTTLITLAHRVHTVISTDRVMMMANGKVVEMDPSHVLLQDQNGAFHKLVHQLPSNEVSLLKQLASDKHENKPYRPPPQSPGLDMGLPYAARSTSHFLPSFQTNRLTGVLGHFTGNRFSTNRF